MFKNHRRNTLGSAQSRCRIAAAKHSRSSLHVNHPGGAIVLDGISYFDRYVEEHPEELLEYSDWMGIPIQGRSIKLDRFKSLLVDSLNRLNRQ